MQLAQIDLHLFIFNKMEFSILFEKIKRTFNFLKLNLSLLDRVVYLMYNNNVLIVRH